MAYNINGEFEVCIDCTIAIANDDYSGIDDATEAKIRAGIERLSAKHGWLVIGDALGFTPNLCDCCGQGAGEKHACNALRA